MGFKAIISILKVVSLLRIYLGAITSAFLRSLQATYSFPNWLSGRRQLTLDCESTNCTNYVGRLPPIAKNNIPLEIFWQRIIKSENPLPRYASGQKVYLSTMYI